MKIIDPLNELSYAVLMHPYMRISGRIPSKNMVLVHHDISYVGYTPHVKNTFAHKINIPKRF